MSQSGGVPESVLSGVRVLEIAEGIAGPLTGMMLAEFGATVIKVEPLQGDWSRTLGPPFIAGHSPAFIAVNVGKRSLPLALDTDRGRAVVRDLAATVDVIVEGYRPGVAEKLGVDKATMTSLNPDLVYVDISGFGATGPKARFPGSDTILQGYSGLMSITGEVDGAPCRVGTPVADTAAGVYGALAAILGLLQRERTGAGSQLSVSLLESLIALQAVTFADYFASGEAPRPLGARSSLFAAPAQAYPTADGYIMVSCHTPRQWRRLCQSIERPDWIDDPRFATNHDRVTNLAELTAELNDVFRSLPTDEWLARFAREGVNAGPILDYPDVVADPQVVATGVFRQLSSDAYGDVTYARSPISIADAEAPPVSPPPLLAEGAAAILAECGYSSEEVASLVADGVVAGAPAAVTPSGGS